MECKQGGKRANLEFARGLRVLLLFFAILFPWERSARSEPIEFPLPPFKEVLIVPVTLEGEEHLFVLDTGMPRTVIDTSLKGLLGKPIKKIEVFDPERNRAMAELFAPPIAHIGGNSIERNAAIACLDLSPIREASGRDIRGFLGMPFFATSVVQIDFDSRKLRIFPFSTVPQEEWGQMISVAINESNQPIVNSRFATYADEPCLIDTGYDGKLSTRAGLFDELLRSEAIQLTGLSHVAGVGGIAETKEGQLIEFEFAGNTHTELSVLGSKSNLSRVGLNFFRRYRVTFDLGHSRIFLEKGFDFHKAEEEDKRIGIALLRKDDKTIVEQVKADSQAARAGFQKHDELVSLAGIDVTSKPLAEIGWIITKTLKTDGRLVADIRRAGVSHSITVHATE